MINQVGAEAMYSATYVENYLDSVENLPNDVQRYLTRIREIDLQYRGKLLKLYICMPSSNFPQLQFFIFHS